MQQGGQPCRRRTWVAEHIGRCKDGLLLFVFGERGSVSVEDLSTGRRQRDVTLLLLVGQRDKLPRGDSKGGGAHPEGCKGKQSNDPQDADAAVDPLRIGATCLRFTPARTVVAASPALGWSHSMALGMGGTTGGNDASHGASSTSGVVLAFVVRPRLGTSFAQGVYVACVPSPDDPVQADTAARECAPGSRM